MMTFVAGVKQRHGMAFLLLCSSTAATLLLAEVICRYALSREYLIWPSNLHEVLTPSPELMPGITGQSSFITNSQGIRADELTTAHTLRILAMGGSTTECLYLDQTETWPHLLQGAVNGASPTPSVWVGNAGMSGRTTRHHVTALRYLPLQEMELDIVILLIGANDFLRRLSRDDLYDPTVLTNPDSVSLLISETFTGSFRYPGDQFPKTTALWQVMRKAKRAAGVDSDEHFVQDRSGAIYRTWRRYRQEASEIRNQLPDLSSALDEYERNINILVDIAIQEEMRMILVTQPAMWRAGLPRRVGRLLWLGGVGDFQSESGHSYYSVPALEDGMERYNETLMKVCGERQIECVDLASALERDTTVFYDDVHFNESGARKVSAVLSDYLVRYGNEWAEY